MEKSNANYKLRFKKLLEKQKVDIEKQLAAFTKKDTNLKGDYDTQFPDFGTPQDSDELAQEVSLYENRLPVEFTLESKLQEIGTALEKIEKGKYGVCEKCGKAIDPKRLETKPEAKYCVKCKTKTS